MKKNIFLLAALSGMFLLASCGSGTESAEVTEATESTEETAVVEEAVEATYTVDAANSKITWTGTAIGVYSHTGTINISEGSVTVSGGQLTGGSFTVDMSSIVPTKDATFNEENTPEKLVGHLNSADFFDIENNPSATLAIKSVDGASATADLTLRGKTGEVTVTDITVTTDVDGVSVTGSLTFNRQEYDVKWSYPEGDMVLSDDIELNFEISANR